MDDPGLGEVGVEFRQLRYFIGLAEELHFGRAASRLFITQPGLSQSMAKLERALNVQLFHRSRRDVQLTDAGLELLHHARRLLADLDEAVERVRSVGRGQAGVLRIGLALLTEHVVAPILAAVAAEHPGIVFDRTSAVSERLLTQLSEGSLHVAVVHQVPALATLPGVDWEVLCRGRLAALMSPGHPLAGQASIALKQLSEETFMVNPRDVAPSAFQGLKLMCTEFGGFDPKVIETGAASTPSVDADWSLIRQGTAIAVTAEETGRGICPPGIAVVPIQSPPGYVLAVAWRRGDQSVLLGQFLGSVRGYPDPNTVG